MRFPSYKERRWRLRETFALFLGTGLMTFVFAGCIREGTRVTLDRNKKSLPTLKKVTPAEAHPGIDAMTAENEQAARNVGAPKTPATPIDFGKDTTNQAGTIEARTNAAELKKQLDAAETRNKWLLGIGMGLLGLLGAKGIWIKRLINVGRSLKQNLGQAEGQVNSLVEATQETIAQAKDKPISADMVKKIHREYQEVHGTWHTLKDLVAKTKAVWEAGQPASAAKGGK